MIVEEYLVNMVKAFCSCLLLLMSAGYLHAQEDVSMRNTFYLGAGSANSDGAFENDDTPFSLGFTHQLVSSKMVLGFDIAGEGTMLDSTWGRDERPKRGTSFNLLLGRNMVDSGRFRADAALLLGVREAAKDCPDSYVGWRCYADRDPETDYKGNFGGVLTLSFDGFALGLRATGESTQVLAGLRF